MGFALKKEYLPHYTIKEWERWEGEWELIKGIPYAMSPAPASGHQRINKKLALAFDTALSGCTDCEAFIPVNIKLDKETVVIPDLAVFCDPIPEQLYFEVMPELVAEILSPTTANKDRNLKFELFQSANIKYYIIISPKTQTIEVYELQNGKYQLVFNSTEGEFSFTFKKCGATVNFSKIW
jgi:Uma2 family endonuclease